MGLLCGSESSRICCCSVTQPCLTLYNSIDDSTPASSALHCLLEFARIHVHWVSDHLILCHPLLLLPSVFPSISVFSNKSALCVGGQSIGASASASVLPVNLKVSFLSERLVWSPWRRRESQESSLAPWFESISSSALSLLYGPTLTFILDYWKNHSFDYADLCW